MVRPQTQLGIDFPRLILGNCIFLSAPDDVVDFVTDVDSTGKWTVHVVRCEPRQRRRRVMFSASAQSLDEAFLRLHSKTAQSVNNLVSTNGFAFPPDVRVSPARAQYDGGSSDDNSGLIALSDDESPSDVDGELDALEIRLGRRPMANRSANGGIGRARGGNAGLPPPPAPVTRRPPPPIVPHRPHPNRSATTACLAVSMEGREEIKVLAVVKPLHSSILEQAIDLARARWQLPETAALRATIRRVTINNEEYELTTLANDLRDVFAPAGIARFTITVESDNNIPAKSA